MVGGSVSTAELGARYSPDKDFRAGGLLLSLLLSSEDSFLSVPALLVSDGAPGVLGVLPELPKLANAPLPNPKADEAPAAVGEPTEDVDIAPSVLNGLLLLLLLKLP